MGWALPQELLLQGQKQAELDEAADDSAAGGEHEGAAAADSDETAVGAAPKAAAGGGEAGGAQAESEPPRQFRLVTPAWVAVTNKPGRGTPNQGPDGSNRDGASVPQTGGGSLGCCRW